MKIWNEKEIQYLKDNYTLTHKNEIIGVIKNSWGSIKAKASKLDIKRIAKNTQRICVEIY